MGQNRTFQSMQVGRGIAAVMVVLFHASAVFAAAKYWNVIVFGGVLDFGYAGVEFFFVLSGFIIAYVHASDVGIPARLPNFIRSRALRIYPVYWLVLIGVIALSLLPYGFNGQVQMTPQVLLSAFALVGPTDAPAVLVVAWTLFHEIAFYIVFGLAISSRRAGMIAIGVWLAGIFAATINHPFLPPYLGDPLNLLFLFGVGAWWWPNHRPESLPLAYAWIGVAGFLALGLENIFAPVFSVPVRQQLFGAASTIIIASLVAQEGRRPIEVPQVASVLGAASYSIYLTHYPVLAFLAKAHRFSVVQAIPVGLSFTVVVAATVLIGVAFHLLIEKPVMRLANATWKRRSRPARLTAMPDD